METMSLILMMAGRFALATALLMALYWAVWRKQATYRAKRTYLLTLPVVALAIALVRVEVYRPEPVVVEVKESLATPVPTAEAPASAPSPTVFPTHPSTPAAGMPVEEKAVANLSTPAIEAGGKWWDVPACWFGIAYTFIIIGLCLPFALNLWHLRRLHRCGRVEEADGERCRIVTAEAVKAPFSCHRTIYLPQSLTEAQRRMILCHELAHIRHRHYRDVWVIETVTRLLWWNPFLWWCRKELRNVHEFEADSDVLATGENVSAYQAILIEEVMHGDVVIANGFNHSFIRRRFIEMIESTNRRMTASGKVASLAGMLTTVAVMCCTVGEAGTVYVRVTSEELQATSKEPQVISEEPQVSAGEESAQDSSANQGVSISIERGKMTVTEGTADSLFTAFFQKADRQAAGNPTPTRSGTMPLSEYKALTETDSVALRNYTLLTSCIRRVQDYRRQMALDSSIDQQEMDRRVAAYTDQTFGEAGIRLLPGGGYRLPDQTVVMEDGKDYGTPTAEGTAEGKATPTRIVQNGKLPFAPVTFDEYGSLVLPFRLERYAGETHLVLYICPEDEQEMVNLSWQATLTDPDTGDRYMLRGIEGFTGDVSAVIVSNCQSVPLQLTYIFPPLDRAMKRVQVRIPGHVEQTCRISEIEAAPARVVRDNALRARCIQPQADGQKPENEAPVMERDKSANYDVQNEHTFPIYTQVQTAQAQVFHRPGDHYRIYRGEGCTYMVETHRVRWDWEFFCHSSQQMLIDPETGTRYAVAGVEHFPLDTYYWVHGQQGQYVRFVSIFPPLPEEVKSVDYFEGHCPRRTNSTLAGRHRSLPVHDSYLNPAAKQQGKVIY